MSDQQAVQQGTRYCGWGPILGAASVVVPQVVFVVLAVFA